MQEIYLRYTPAVEFTSWDDAYPDLSGTLHSHPPPEELARRIQQEVEAALHLSVSTGIGPNKLLTQIASVMLFSKTYQQFGHLTRGSGPYLITGAVQSRLPGEANLLVEKLEVVELRNAGVEGGNS